MFRDEGWCKLPGKWYIVEQVLSEYYIGDNAENHAFL
jgi:hypothetical protein